jgi:hypothetical protein
VRRGKRNWIVGRKGPLIMNACIGLTHQMTLLCRAVGMAYASGLRSNWNEVATAETRKQTLKKSFCHIEVIDGGLADVDADVTNPFLVQGGKGSSKVVPKKVLKYGERDSSHQNEVC